MNGLTARDVERYLNSLESEDEVGITFNGYNCLLACTVADTYGRPANVHWSNRRWFDREIRTYYDILPTATALGNAFDHLFVEGADAEQRSVLKSELGEAFWQLLREQVEKEQEIA